MTRRDPIVAEVRKHRAAIAREHGNDLDAIIAGVSARGCDRHKSRNRFVPPETGRQPALVVEGSHDSAAQQAAAPDGRAAGTLSGRR
jgi:hypothetical protein